MYITHFYQRSAVCFTNFSVKPNRVMFPYSVDVSFLSLPELFPLDFVQNDHMTVKSCGRRFTCDTKQDRSDDSNGRRRAAMVRGPCLRKLGWSPFTGRAQFCSLLRCSFKTRCLFTFESIEPAVLFQCLCFYSFVNFNILINCHWQLKKCIDVLSCMFTGSIYI